MFVASLEQYKRAATSLSLSHFWLHRNIKEPQHLSLSLTFGFIIAFLLLTPSLMYTIQVAASPPIYNKVRCVFFDTHSSSHLPFSYIPMEILPISPSHLIKSQITPFTDKLREGHKFKTCLKQQKTGRFPSSPLRTDAPPRRKNKVVFILGSTGTGKSKLAIDLAIHFDGEVVNSDKMQVYAGLDIITNKVTDEECAGVPHHLIGGVHPDADFTAFDFCREANRAIESIVARGRLPIIAGGSNSYIERLVDDDKVKFRSKYECCFIWIDVDLPVLHSFVSERVDKMVDMGLVEEARTMFDPNGDYSKGIRRSIGVSEMDRYFRAESSFDEETKGEILKEAINDIKENTMKLTYNQLRKIRRLSRLPGWEVQRVDATEAFRWRRNPEAERVWTIVAKDPSIKIVQKFLNSKLDMVSICKMAAASEPSTVTIMINVKNEHKVGHEAVDPRVCTTGKAGMEIESGSLSGPLVC